MSVSLRGARRATATALAASLTGVALITSACAPAQTTGTKVISGTIQGADGKIVDVLVGFDAIDGAGHKLDLGGGRVGYSAIQRLNHCVPTYGATASQRCSFNGVTTQITGRNWSIRVPASVQTLYIEVYPKAPTPTAWLNNYRGYTGVAAGKTVMTTYSSAYKRAVPVPTSTSGIRIVLPKVCGTPGGTTGSLYGHIANWPAGQTGSANAWSMAAQRLDTQGFATGTVNGNGDYQINGLQSLQKYSIIASTAGFSRTAQSYALSQSSLTYIPRACAQKHFDF